MPQSVLNTGLNKAKIITRLASNTLFSKGGGNSVNVDTLEKTTQSTRAKGWAEGSDKRLEAEEGCMRYRRKTNMWLCVI